MKFESKVSIEESVQQLSKVAKKCRGCLSLTFVSSGKLDSQLAGIVSKNRVVLVRAKSWLVKNMGKPHFYGRFVKNSDGQVTLEGYFGVGCWTKFASWVGGITVSVFELAIIISVLGLSPDDQSLSVAQRIFGVLFIPGVLFLTTPIGIFAKKYLFRDIEWISNQITQALQ